MKAVILLSAALLFLGSGTLHARQTTVSTIGALAAAIDSADPGDVIYLRGGTYKCTSQIVLSRSGTPARKIGLYAYPKDSKRPRLDFSSMEERSTNQGILLRASYWHLKGIDVFKAGDNGLLVAGGHKNVIEFCTFSECSDSGLQISKGSSGNTVLNCDSFFNADTSRENADGFACKMDAGTGNKFVGCRAWQNLDDGWDGYLRGTDGISTVYENCWAFKNGYLKDGSPSGGDGNGFKTGGSDNKKLRHDAVLRNCIASGNRVKGFDHNSNRGNVTLYNCIAHGNGTNMGFGRTNPVATLTIKNCAVLGPVGPLYGTTAVVSHNSWQNGILCNDSDFQSVDMSQLAKPRNRDGGLPAITYLRPVRGSDLIDRGVNVGLPFHASAPDLGAFELNPGATGRRAR